jgi:predicted XRE-type DNA-binding protein
MTRDKIQQQIIVFAQTMTTKAAVGIAIKDWLTQEKCTDFEIQQIMNDLNSYLGYNDLI